MLEEDLKNRFKDPEDHFRLVFVFAIWMAGFDVHFLFNPLPG